MKEKIKKIKLKPKFVIIMAVIVAIIVGGISTILSMEKTKKRNNAVISIPVYPVTFGKGDSPYQNLTLSFPMSGRVKNVFVKIGQRVKAGDILASLDSGNALGTINQAKAAYESAQTAYQKLLNGASETQINVAQTALANAKSTYDNVVNQQRAIVSNAFITMMNTGLQATSTTDNTIDTSTPSISGTYTGKKKGSYVITTYKTGSGTSFSFSGIESGTGQVKTTATPLGTLGLYLKFPSVNVSGSWTISIPNIKASTYQQADDAYNLALKNQAQAVSAAQGAVDSAQAALNQVEASARPEDLSIAKAQVENTKGALQVAQSLYENTLIKAPVNGVITNVSITTGQIVSPATPVIELLSN